MVAVTLGLGLLVGLVIGALGGGGSILTVPLLVFVLGLSAQQATSASLVIVGITAVVASLSHARSGHTAWRTGLLLAAAGVPASVLGTRLNRLVDDRVLLLAFSVLMLVAATGMALRSAHEYDGIRGQLGSDPPLSADHRALTHDRPRGNTSRRGRGLQLVAAGLVIGFLTGFLGVGGGFVIVPVLVVALGLAMPAAVGTSLLVIALNSGVALLARAGQGGFVGEVIVPFTLTAVAGSLLGERISDRLPAVILTRAFAVLLVLVAGYVAVRALT